MMTQKIPFPQFISSQLIQRLFKYAALTVRDVQHAILNLGYTSEELLKNCPKAPEGPDYSDPSVRRMKAVLAHPIGDYAVQPRDATFAAHGVTAAHCVKGGVYTGKVSHVFFVVLLSDGFVQKEISLR